MLKVAVIGLGTMGVAHLDAWMTVPEVKVVAVCGRDPEKTRRLADRYGADPFTSFDAMCENADLDLVDICLPTQLHAEYVELAARAGKHIVCEKPLALDPGTARRLAELCERCGVKLMVAHDLRFCPEYRQAHDRIVAGELGRIGVARLSRRSSYPRGADNWYADASKSGGMIMDLLIHDLDWLLWTFGPARRVTALRASRQSEQEPLDYALLTIRFVSGTIAHVEGSWAHAEFRSSFEIAGTQGMLVEEGMHDPPLTVYKRAVASDAPGVVVPEMTLHRNPYEMELAHFAECLRTGRDPIIGAEEAVRAVELAAAAIESVRTGQPVTLDTGGEQG